MKTWFSIKAMSDVAHVRIYDEIGGYGVKASALTDEINACGNVSEIHLSIHSPGGDIFEGLAIYNALKNHPAKKSYTLKVWRLLWPRLLPCVAITSLCLKTQ